MGEYWPDERSHSAKRAKYTDRIGDIRRNEYPMLNGTTYLDHAATTPAPASLLSAFSQAFTQNLFGNPHSASSASQLTTQHIDDTRLRVLQLLKASPTEFDVVFVANATAGVKLVADAFRDAGEDYHANGFEYIYHREVHTSLVGVREIANQGSRCLDDDRSVEEWLHGQEDESVSRLGQPSKGAKLSLFAYPGQSNMNGHRPDPKRQWCKRIHQIRSATQQLYTLFDAAAFVTTSPLDLSDPATAPDFTVLSFYKIYGFPDLGAVIVRKDSGEILKKRRYFGGGTVEMVIAGNDPWHSKKSASYHDRLEDGTVPFHSIVALGLAMTIHERLYGSMKEVALHTGILAQTAAERLSQLRHANGKNVCHIYTPGGQEHGIDNASGPIVALNVQNSEGEWVGKSEIEKLAAVKNIQLRTGTLCNPGGTASCLGLSAEDMLQNFSKGQRCGDDHDLMNGLPTGVLRISFGAMSSMEDVDAFLTFIEEFYVDKNVQAPVTAPLHPSSSNFHIESLYVFPIKSCAGYRVPSDQSWEVRPEGLAWDREWCLIHQGTGSALSQKRYPQMALLRPEIDLRHHVLRIAHSIAGTSTRSVEISLSGYQTGTNIDTINICAKSLPSKVCGDTVEVQVYSASAISTFFTEALGVPCTLARFPPRSSSRPISRPMKVRKNNSVSQLVSSPKHGPAAELDRSILLSNESPILLVSRSSVNRLNENIKAMGGARGVSKAVPADSFRGNIVVAQDTIVDGHLSHETPYVEDQWKILAITSPMSADRCAASQDSRVSKLKMEVLGPCQRCQMVSIDQQKGERQPEPFSTLAKTRKWNGGVWFGVHLCPIVDLAERDPDVPGGRKALIKVGDTVTPA